jgi:hypothetical protein
VHILMHTDSSGPEKGLPGREKGAGREGFFGLGQ